MLIGHRGATGYIDEHTLEGYSLALEKGADYIELDVQLTKDGKLLCMHDSTLDRTTTGTGNVNKYTLDYIQNNFSTKNGYWIPSLEDVFKKFGKYPNYYIETKRPFDVNMDAELLRQLYNYELIGHKSRQYQVVLQSFALESLINIKNQYSDIPLVYLISKFNSTLIQEAKSIGAYAIAPKYTTITQDLVTESHKNELKVHAWTVNTKEEMNYLVRLGVDGIFTNYLDEYQK